MKGWQIFLHSVRQVTGNLEGALRVSALPYAIQVIVGLLLAGAAGQMAGMGGPGPSGAMMGGFGIGALVALIVSLATALWIAVAWHRFVLLNEQPQGFVPVWRGDRIAEYFLRSLGYGLILTVAAMVLAMIAGMLFSPLLRSGSYVLFLILSALVVQIPLMIFAFRLSAALPGAALDSGHDFMAGWQATQGQTADIAVLAAIAVVAHLVLALLGLLVFSHLWVLAVLWQIVAGWLVTMVAISILTTLYGHYIERRPLV